MEVDGIGPLDDHVPLQTGGSPLPLSTGSVQIRLAGQFVEPPLARVEEFRGHFCRVSCKPYPFLGPYVRSCPLL